MTIRGNPFKIRNWQWWSFTAVLLVASLFLFNLHSVSANDAVAMDAAENWLSSTTVPDWAAGPERSSETVSAQQANRNFCYAVADGYIQNGDQIRDGMAVDTLAYLDRTNGTTASVDDTTGNTGVNNIEAIAFRPGGEILYAANAGRLGTLHLTTGLFTPVGPAPFGQAEGFINGVPTIEQINDVDGLSWDVTTDTFYGTERRESGEDPDLLFQIDPDTGLVVQDAFTVNGTAVDFVAVETITDPNDQNMELHDVDDLAIDPVTGDMYASINSGGSTVNFLAVVDKASGAIISAQRITDGTGADVKDIEGLSFFNDGNLYGSSGKDAVGAPLETLYQIDKETAVATIIGDFTDPLRDFEGLSCLTAEAAIAVEKATNGEDANNPPGPTIQAGDPVTWTYFVRNTGVQTLTNVIVTDDQGVSVTCPQTTLFPSEAMTCTATGTATVGQYANLGTAEGEAVLTGEIVTDIDPSHYFGGGPGIEIEKATNGEDADTPTGPTVAVGDTVTWTYVVTNTGNVTLTNVTVTDSDLGAITCPEDTLAAGESMTCTATGTAVAGQYANTGTVTGTPPAGDNVTDSDPSHYFGATGPSIEIEKATNGEDADTPTGPTVAVGSTVTWTYVVTNTGDVALTNVMVSDDQGVTVTCPEDTLAVGESMTCTAMGTAVAGQYANMGTVMGTPPTGGDVTDSDPSHYFGSAPDVQVEKTLVQTGAAQDGIVTVGQELTFSIQIQNTGNTTLTVVPLQDSYDPIYLEFLRATPAPDDAATAGTLLWNDLTGPGTLPPQEQISVTVTFLARASTDALPNKLTINRAIVEGATDGTTTVPPVEDDASIRITNPMVAVSKTVIDPPDGEVEVNGLVTFTIAITNTGDTTLAIIPVRDVYIPEDLEFVRTSLTTVPQTSAGELFWSDVTPELGDVPPGDAISFDITFRFINEDVTSTTNIVRLGEVIDEHGDPAGTPQGEADTSTVTKSVTAITLLSFTATATPGGVEIQWRTGAEIETLGFHLWRSSTHLFEDAVQVTNQMIGAKGQGGAGASYQYIDTSAVAGTNYYYWLQEVELGGDTAIYGPVAVKGPGVTDPPSGASTFFLPFVSN